MKEKIERFSKGVFEYELPSISLSKEEIVITVESGKVFEGSFIISNSIGRLMKGAVYSSNQLMQVKNPYFAGVENIIAYHFDATYLKPGEEIRGNLSIVSDCGETSILYSVQVEVAHFASSLGKIKDLYQFTNLARVDWSEAKKIFKSENFEAILLKNEERYRYIYRHLLKSISTSQALEEFLIAIHKKPAIHLNIDKQQVEYDIDENIMDKLTLTKDHWGYAEIRVSTDAPFIQLEQKFLWADRFIGNTHQIAYMIDTALLKPGNNFGHIYIKTTYQTITVDVVCRYKKAEKRVLSEKRLRQRTEYAMTDNYLNFRLNRINIATYIGETQKLMKELTGDENTFRKDLIKAHLAVISGKSKIAEELLSGFEEIETLLRKKHVFEYCAYLYLKALYRKDDATTRTVTETIRDYYERGHNDWRILWFLLYTDSRYEKNKGAKFYDIKEQFEAGCRSPILYFEAVCILNEEPYLLRELTDFEIQILNFGIKNSLVSRVVADQFTYLAGKKKNFDRIIFQGLVKLYESYESTDILPAICCMLIKGLKRDEKYFEWYKRGVEEQLKITELHEYYMYSVSDDYSMPLAQPVLLYFIYNSSLNDKKKAFLYANIIKNKDRLGAIYRTYLKKIEVFTVKMLEAHQISWDLAVLYNEYFENNGIGPELAEHLPYVLYRHELICENRNMVSVTVLHKEVEAEETVLLQDGKAQINLYSKSAEIFLADSFGNRFIESVDYEVLPYLNAEDYEQYCMEYSNHPMLLLHLFDRYQSYRIVNEKAIALRKNVLLMEDLAEEYRTECHQTLIEFYYDNYDDEQLEYYLGSINLTKIRPQERMKFVEFMVIRAFHDKVLDALELFGYTGIAINRLTKFCSGWLATPAAEKKHELMLYICYYVFSQGKYDESILRYLIRYYEGSISDMLSIWRAAKGFEVECSLLEERLLTFMLVSESFRNEAYEIFEAYYKEVTNSLMVRAFLTYAAYRYLVHEESIPEDLVKVMKRELNYEENDFCLLAWLKYNAGNAKLTEQELIFVGYNLQKLVKQGIVLPFFQAYGNRVALPDKITDKYIVTYHGDPKKQIFIHYRLQDKQDSFKTERMTNVFNGIHSKEFVLFYNENLEYYITEETEEGILTTDIVSLQFQYEDNRISTANYHSLNQMLMAYEQQEEEKLLNMMEDYIRQEYYNSACFRQV